MLKKTDAFNNPVPQEGDYLLTFVRRQDLTDEEISAANVFERWLHSLSDDDRDRAVREALSEGWMTPTLHSLQVRLLKTYPNLTRPLGRVGVTISPQSPFYRQ